MKLEPLDLLVIAPHPDDAEIFCGGIIATCIQQNRRVGILDLTKGELSSRGDLKTRAIETTNATKILGVAWRRNLELPDGSIGIDHRKGKQLFLSREEQLKKLVGVIRSVTPSLILAPYWKERHPDHERASHLVKEAVFFAGVRKFESLPKSKAITSPQLAYYQLRVAFSPNLIVDTSNVWNTKLKAMHAYSSQFGLTTPGRVGSKHKSSRASQNPDTNFETLLSSPLSISSIQSRDAYYGAMIGAHYGEPLLTHSPIKCLDPLDLLGSERTQSFLFPG